MQLFNQMFQKVDNVTRNPERVKHLMKTYARNLGTQVSNETLKKRYGW